MLQKKPFLFTILTILILLIPVFPIFADSTLDPKTQTIDLIIEKSGIQVQAASITSLFNEPSSLKLEEESAETEAGKEVKPENSNQFDTIVQKNFAPENILAGIRQIFLKQYNEKSAQEVLAFYDTELGAKIAQCEIASADPAFMEKMAGFDIEDYDRGRRRLITRLFGDMKMMEFQSKVQIITFDFMVRSINAALPKEIRTPDANITELSKKLKKLTGSKEFSALQHDPLLNQCYIIYENLTDDELAEYDKFVKSKPGKWLIQCTQTGMLNSMKKCGDQLIIDLAAYTDSKPQDEAGETEEAGDEEMGDI